MPDHEEHKLTRRALLATTGGAAAGVLAACAPSSSAPSSSAPSSSARLPGEGRGEDPQRVPRTDRMPVVYVPHGGGPWPFVDVGFGEPAEWESLRSYLTTLSEVTAARPRALLVISAHWEAPVPTVQTAPRPPLLYDYSGFPPASYEITWPAPGAPDVAARVRALLSEAGLESAEDERRGFDHGTFVPLKLSYPQADVPCVQLSLQRGLDPAAHLRIGRALAPLRDEGVFLIGSGMSFHNMRGFGTAAALAPSVAFDGWLRETVGLQASARDARLTRWEDAPSARACHPREEHLLPLMVIAGAAGEDRGRAPYSERLMGTRVSAVHFG